MKSAIRRKPPITIVLALSVVWAKGATDAPIRAERPSIKLPLAADTFKPASFMITKI